MLKFVKSIRNFIVRLYLKATNSGLYKRTLPEPDPGSASPKMSELVRRAAAEGAVLLENDGTLPLSGDLALFGRAQIDPFYAGYGLSGEVNSPYLVGILEGIERSALKPLGWLKELYRAEAKARPADRGKWGALPQSFPEIALGEETVRRAASETDTAVIVFGRAAGEENDCTLAKGSYYLSAEEERLLRLCRKHFKKVAVVLNAGNLIDLSFAETYRVNALLLVWHGGMEAGNAVADLLSGETSPCGKLPASVPKAYGLCPSAMSFLGGKRVGYTEDIYVGYRYFETFAKDGVRYPFGFGLSYTDFSAEGELRGETVLYRVKNEGSRAGREVVQVYVKKPCGELGNPARQLVGFRKTKLLPPGGEETGRIVISPRELCSYDAAKSAYILAAGKYEVYLGTDVRSAKKIGEFVRGGELTEQLSEQCAPQSGLRILTGKTGDLGFALPRKSDPKQKILAGLPPELHAARKGDLSDVFYGKITLDEFVAGLSFEELEALSRGDFDMDSPLGPKGNTGAFGGVTPSLREKGVPPVWTADGPSGLRLGARTSLVPDGILLGATFDEELVEEVYRGMGEEVSAHGMGVLLAPGLNLMRDPLCGRNFEYFSEDPFLTGKLGAAAVRGMQGAGASACVKHFACNNRERDRMKSDSRVSERALREVYLRGFEICVKEASPDCVMTSYNKVNGIWSCYHYELVRGILRGEWGFRGCVMTDWWTQPDKSPHFKRIKNNSYRVRAGVNVLMPGGGYVGKGMQGGSMKGSLGKKEGITLGELQQNAKETLGMILAVWERTKSRD